MMSRKGKKGFQRLETHEMASLNGQSKLDSGSEDDILNLTVEDHGGRMPGGGGSSFCYSCCIWFSILYVGLLTILVLLLGAFSGYILVTTWQIEQHRNSSTISLHDEISKLQADLAKQGKTTFYILDGLKTSMFSINSSSTSLRDVVNTTYKEMMQTMDDLDQRLMKIETHPQSVLIKQIDTIHQEMSILDSNMGTLNRSLAELREMRNQMASMDSVLNSYDSKLKELSKVIGDTIHDNTDIQDSVQGFSDRIQNFSKKLLAMDSRMNRSHVTMQQTMNLSSTKLLELYSLIEVLNETSQEEMERMWTNLTNVDFKVSGLQADVDTLSGNLTSLFTLRHTERPTQEEEFQPAAATPPPVPTQAITEPTQAASIEPLLPLPTTVEDDMQRAKTTSFGTVAETADQTQIEDEMEIDTENPLDISGGPTPVPVEKEVGTKRPPGIPRGPKPVPITPSDTEEVVTVEGTPSNKGSSGLNAGISILQKLYDQFLTYDLNGDGVLSRGEFLNYLNMPNMFAILDADGDGLVTQRELQRVLASLKGNGRGNGEAPPTEEASNFNRGVDDLNAGQKFFGNGR